MRKFYRNLPIALVAGALMIAALILPARNSYGFNSIFSGDYQLQLITEPEPPLAGAETTITIKVLRIADGMPAQGGRLIVTADEIVREIKDQGFDLSNMYGSVKAAEADEFGNYDFTTTFSRAETFYIKVAILEIEGTRYDPPLRAGFTLIVEPSKEHPVRMSFIALLFIAMTLIAWYIVYIRRTIPADPEGFNLLQIGWIRRALTWKHIQTVFQVPLLIGFIALILIAFLDIQDGGKNISTKFIWTIWWAGIIFTFVLVGRLWCFMCPVGALAEWTAKLSRATKRFPPPLRNIWLANLMFIMFTWLDVQLGVVRSPLVTGILFIFITLVAVGVALRYERRTFCRYLCPIGGIIGLYSMFSPVELRARNCTTCKEHALKECYLGTSTSKGCPMFEVLPKMDSNNACNFCGECISSCSQDNVTIRVRAFFKDAWTMKRLSLDEAALAVVLVGISIFITGDMLEPWEGWIASAMTMVPADFLGIEYEYTVEVLTKSFLYFSVSLFLIPGLMLMSVYLSNKMVGPENHNGLRKTFTIFGYMFIPIGLSLHLAHNAGHLLKEAGGIVPAFQRLINKYTPYYLGEPDWQMGITPLIDASFLYWIQMGIFAVFYLYSLYAGYRLSLNNYKDRKTAFRAFMPMLALSFVFMMTNVYLLNLPMAPRHIH